MNAVSLFSNIGVAEAYLEEIGLNVVVANEMVERRAKLYKRIYPQTHMIIGDVKQEKVFKEIVEASIAEKVDVVIATPPCQGMSTVGQKKKDDERNRLILPIIDLVKEIKPKYVFIENVPAFLKTSIKVNEKNINIIDIIQNELGSDYHINIDLVDARDYSVPQTRERAIFLMTRKEGKNKIWEIPSKDSKVVTMEETIGHLPIVDPFLHDISKEELVGIFPEFYERKDAALKISSWHNPPHHVKRQIIAMRHTPTGRTAFDNDIYIPRKINGEAVKGYRNTYKRQNWDTPAYTVTMDNRKISSQNNVHPGRYLGKDINGEVLYSDPRALTVYELMLISSLPDDWPVPTDISEAFLRSIIGEGIPPLLVKKIFNNIMG